MMLGWEDSLPDMPREEPASCSWRLDRATVLPAIEAILLESIDADIAVIYVRCQLTKEADERNVEKKVGMMIGG